MKKKWLVRVVLVVFALGVAWEVAGYYFVSADAEKVVADINAGKAVWSDYYKLDLAENLQDNLLREESPSIVTKIMETAEIEAKASPLLLNTSKVTFLISTVNYMDFIKHCESLGFTEQEQMLAQFEGYETNADKTSYEVVLDWKWYITTCEKDLQTVELVDASTGGFLSYYNELMNAAEADLENLLGGKNDETDN